MASVRQEIRRPLVSAGMPPERADSMILCAGEAMTNALKHAGGGDVSLHRRSDIFTILVRDHGRGIEALNLPEVALTHGYSTAGTLGMGYKLMISLADHVYLATSPQGTTLGVSMHISQEAAKPFFMAG
jgi:anti-sigma regulatory factor (Ser/Thr protein kinase)